MSRVGRVVRAAGVGLTVAAGLPLCLTSCASTGALESQAAELRAAADSNLLATPAERVYELAGVTAVPSETAATPSTASTSTGGTGAAGTAPTQPGDDAPAIDAEALAALSELVTAQTSGFVVVSDGVITAAELRFELPARSEGSFVLTSPAVLHQAGEEAGAVYLIGSLFVDGVEQPPASVRLIPSQLSDDHAEFDVSIALAPAVASNLSPGQATMLQELSLRLEFATSE